MDAMRSVPFGWALTHLHAPCNRLRPNTGCIAVPVPFDGVSYLKAAGGFAQQPVRWARVPIC